MNNGFSILGYFKHERRTCKRDPISAYLFVLVLEILFIQVRKSDNIQGLKISTHEFLLSSSVDDSDYFVGNSNSVQELFRLHSEFEQFSTLKVNRETSSLRTQHRKE